MKQLTGSEIVIECLKEQGVDTVFGYPGGTILNIYDELYKHSKEITHILTSHEQGAAHAADGYARATGKVGVCMATSGPGATNLVTGIATAFMDSVPMVAITANVGVSLLGKDSFQEVDIAGVVMPITKHSFIVKNVHELASTIRRAFKIAQTGRPGPVLVDITKDRTGSRYRCPPRSSQSRGCNRTRNRRTLGCRCTHPCWYNRTPCSCSTRENPQSHRHRCRWSCRRGSPRRRRSRPMRSDPHGPDPRSKGHS